MRVIDFFIFRGSCRFWFLKLFFYMERGIGLLRDKRSSFILVFRVSFERSFGVYVWLLGRELRLC